MPTFRPGSEGAADQKMVKGFKIGFVLATIAGMILLATVPLLKTEAAQTGTGLKALSWFCFVGCFGVLILENWITNTSSNSWRFGVLWFVFFGLAMLLRIVGGV